MTASVLDSGQKTGAFAAKRRRLVPHRCHRGRLRGSFGSANCSVLFASTPTQAVNTVGLRDHLALAGPLAPLLGGRALAVAATSEGAIVTGSTLAHFWPTWAFRDSLLVDSRMQKALQVSDLQGLDLARPVGIEPTTPAFGAQAAESGSSSGLSNQHR